MRQICVRSLLIKQRQISQHLAGKMSSLALQRAEATEAELSVNLFSGSMTSQKSCMKAQLEPSTSPEGPPDLYTTRTTTHRSYVLVNTRFIREGANCEAH